MSETVRQLDALAARAAKELRVLQDGSTTAAQRLLLARKSECATPKQLRTLATEVAVARERLRFTTEHWSVPRTEETEQ